MPVKKQGKIMETDLYKPIYDYLTCQGYTVRSEVKNCDITAVRGDELVVIELKRGFNLKLLIQATRRQRAADSVYVAVPRPKGGPYTRSWNDMCHLLRRLELGLIVVDFRKEGGEAEVVFHPAPFSRSKNSRQRKSIIREISSRYADYNTGGSTGRKLMTAYRENSLYIACCLKKLGPQSPAALKKMGTGPKTSTILYKNFYGWFQKVSRGVYDLHSSGAEYIGSCPELTAHYYGLIEEALKNAKQIEKNWG